MKRCMLVALSLCGELSKGARGGGCGNCPPPTMPQPTVVNAFIVRSDAEQGRRSLCCCRFSGGLCSAI